jgi:hypothetical protein
VTLSVNSLGVKSSSTISLRQPVLGLTPLRTAVRRMEVPPRSGGADPVRWEERASTATVTRIRRERCRISPVTRVDRGLALPISNP